MSGTLVAFSVQTSGRNRPVASAKPATAPVASAVGGSRPRTPCPTCRARSRRRPARRPRPRAAAMLSPVPADDRGSQVAPAHAAGRRARRGRPRAASAPSRARRRSGRAGRAAVVDGRRPVARPRRVTAIGDHLAGELQRQPVVWEQHARDPGEHVGLVLAQPRELGDGEDATGTLPTTFAHASAPEPSTSAAASGADSVSFQSLAGRTTRRSSSSTTIPCCCPATVIASTSAPASRRQRRPNASHQPPGPARCAAADRRVRTARAERTSSPLSASRTSSLRRASRSRPRRRAPSTAR